MSEWQKVKLGEIASSIQTGPFGSQLHQSDYSDEGTPVVMPKDIINGHIDETTIARVEKHHVDRLVRHKITEGDIIYARRGDVGKCAYIVDNQNGWLCGTGCLKVTIDRAKAIPKFVFFQLQKRETIGWVEKHAIGATMLNLNTSILSEVPIELPSLLIQNRVVEILSRYDTLIENYQKQIKLLEEAAQRLYKEWFVDLRFPGYENAKMVDGLPEGWERKKLGEVCEVNKTSIAKNYAYNYVNYNDLGNVREGSIQEPVRYVYGQEPGRAKRVAKDGDVIWGMVRPNLKSYALVQNPKPQDVYSTGFAVLSSKAVPFSFLYCAVITDDFVGYLVNCTNGAAYPAVKAVHFENAVLLVPSRSLLDEFSKFAEPLFRKCGKLSSQIRLLTEARDRLLPKLMGGKMEVDAPKGQRATSIEQRSGHNEQTTNAPKGQKH